MYFDIVNGCACVYAFDMRTNQDIPTLAFKKEVAKKAKRVNWYDDWYTHAVHSKTNLG